ncbi:MAG: two-component regulator propeller domain-containing protein [Balneolaceae bacterium]
MARRFLISAMILLLTFGLFREGESQTLPFRSYSIEQGLSESVARELLQDQNGYIWIGTGYGLNRFDGTRFKSYYQRNGLNDNQINALFEDHEGRLWIGTDSGINVMENDSIRSHPSLEGLKRYVIDSIYRDHQGEWWFGTEGAGVWLWDNNRQLTQYSSVHGLAGNRVREISQDEEGTLWFATDQGLTSLESGNFKTYTRDHGLPHEELHDLEVGEDGRIWLATERGISIWDGSDFTSFGTEEGLIANSVLSISLQGNGRAWVGTESGAARFENGRFRNYTTGEGLTSNIVYSTLIDREGHAWLGTLGGGANLFLGEYFYNFTVDDGLSSNVITSFVEDREGNLWIASYGGGVIRYDGEEFESYFVEDGLADNKVYTLFKDPQNRIWIGTAVGISLIENGKLQPSPEPFSSLNSVRRFFKDPDNGDFWIATYNDGLFRYDGEELTQYTEEDVLENNTVMSIQKDRQGRLWLGTYGGVTVLDNGEFTTYSTEHGLPSNGVIKVYLDQNDRAWFATFNGFARFNDGQIETFESSFGLSETISYFMFQDDREKMWIGTNIGLVRFDYEKYRQADSELERDLSFRLLTKDQGLIANEMNAGAVYRDGSGSFWLGSVEGISRFFPEQLPEYTTPPLVHLEEVIVGGEMAQPGERKIFSHDQNFVQFEFTGISFDAPENILFEYRMSGVDEEWTRGYDRRVRYPSLSPGEYHFQVRAYNSSGVKSDFLSGFEFDIRQPLWFQWWFLVLMACFIIAAIFFIYHYYRVRRMVEIERMRVQIASDLHDDVGSSLTELALQTDFIRTGNLEEAVEETLKQIGDHSRRIVSALDDIVWSIDARNDTIGDLTDRMQDHVNRLFSAANVQVDYNFSGLEMNESLPVQIKENLYLIFKEAINNIAKHSNADHIAISLQMSQNKFRLNVTDNGTLRTDKRKSGQGLRNMNMRAKRIGANVDIEDEQGFQVTVEGSLHL